MGWQELADAVIARRVELGHPTRDAFITASGIGARTMGDLETARRTSYSRSTLARLERALKWRPGTVNRIIGLSKPAARPSPEPVDVAAEMRTPAGLMRHMAHDDFSPVYLLHLSGLDEGDTFDAVTLIRARIRQFEDELLVELAEFVRARGGTAPTPVLPAHRWMGEVADRVARGEVGRAAGGV